MVKVNVQKRTDYRILIRYFLFIQDDNDKNKIKKDNIFAMI
jgi:hypothetical protein